MNIFTFTGNLGNDAEVKYTAGGTAVCNISVAVKAGFGDKAHTVWVRCALFGKRAESGLIPYLTKGQQVCVSGELDVREWEKDGNTQKSVEVKINEIDLIGGKKEQRDGIVPAPQQSNNAGGKTADDFEDSDLPF